MNALVPMNALNAVNGSIVDLASPLAMAWPKQSGIAEKHEETLIKAKLTGDNCPRLAEVVIYEHINFGGASAQTSLNWRYVGDWWNDKVSSIVVLGGVWRFYEHANYGGRYWDLRIGQYPWVQSVGIPNDLISSFQLIAFC